MLLARVIETKQDKVTSGLVNISIDHAYIHEGKGFSLSLRPSLAASAHYLASFKTPSDKYIHLHVYETWSDADSATIEILEGVTLTAETGTALTPVNRNRNSTAESACTLLTSPTMTDDGDTLENLAFSAVGGNSQPEIEFVLKPDTEYVVRITNTSAASGEFGLFMFWTEEDAG